MGVFAFGIYQQVDMVLSEVVDFRVRIRKAIRCKPM